MPNPSWKIGWGFTSACNMHCPFCYSKTARRNVVETDLDVANAFADANHDQITSINYGTGECSLSENWYPFIARTEKLYPHIRQSLTTNGSVATVVSRDPGKRRAVVEAIAEIDISIDYAAEERHNALRGHEDAYRWTIDTLEFCRAEGIVPTIVFVGHNETLMPHSIDSIFDLAAKYGAFVRMNLLRPVEGTRMAPPSYQVAKAGIEHILASERVVSLCDPLFGSLYDPERAQPDTSGSMSLRILPEGNITPSTYLIVPEWFGGTLSGDLSLSEIHASAPFRTLREAEPPVACRECPVVQTCRGGAYDRRVLFYGTLEERDPYCPLRHGEELPAPRKLLRTSLAEAPVAHDGYLPTMIFAPKG